MRHRFLPLIAYLILTAAVAYAIAQTHANSTKTLRAGLVNSCERVNVLRAQSNISNDVSFVILSDAATREAKLAVAVPGRFHAIHAKSAKALFAQAHRLEVTPMTDCKQAVGNPAHYDFPAAQAIDGGNGKESPVARRTLALSKRVANKDFGG